MRFGIIRNWLFAFAVLVGLGVVLASMSNNPVGQIYSVSDALSLDGDLRDVVVKGVVEEGSLHFLDDGECMEFGIADQGGSMLAIYSGVIPAEFSEGEVVVLRGHINEGSVFVVDEVVATK